jgi:hypothetical protein
VAGHSSVSETNNRELSGNANACKGAAAQSGQRHLIGRAHQGGWGLGSFKRFAQRYRDALRRIGRNFSERKTAMVDSRRELGCVQNDRRAQKSNSPVAFLPQIPAGKL